MNMTKDELKYQKNAEILFELIGIKVAFKSLHKYYNNDEYVECYEIKSISGVDLKLPPRPAIVLNFSDGSSHEFKSIEEFDELIGKVGQYGSISELLIDKEFSL